MELLRSGSPLIVLFLCVIFILKIDRWHRRRRNEHAYSLQHGCQAPKSWNARWPLGLDMLLKARRHARDRSTLKLFLQLVAESGATFEQTLLGARALNTIDPENIEAILSSKFVDYSLGFREKSFRPLLGSGIFTQDGMVWKQSRQLLRPHFATAKTQTFEHIRHGVDKLVASVPEDGVVDLQPLFFNLTFRTSAFLLFGDHADAGRSQATFSTAFQIAQNYLPHRVRLGKFYWAANDRSFRNACKACHEFVDERVDKALRKYTSGKADEESHCPSLVESLIERTRDRRLLRDQCLNMLLAAGDTTGCCLSWTFLLLSQRQDVLDCLRREIDEMCGLGPLAQPPSREALRCMRYLNQVVKEVLRLYPSIPINSRTATRLTNLPVGGGPDGKSPILVRPGEAVRYSVYGMHRRKDIYGDDADEFRPERWADDRLKSVGWGYLPFNGGPRVCLGRELALLEITCTVARMVQLFPTIRPAQDDRDAEMSTERHELGLTLSASDGCCVFLGGYET